MSMPTCLVLAMWTMVPRLEAHESILAVNRTATAMGTTESASALARAWESAADPTTSKAKANPDALIQRGFAVRKIPKRRATPAT